MEEGCWKIKNRLCRCCHAEGIFSSLSETDHATMLMECLNVCITQVNGDISQLTYAICQPCIAKLNDAVLFKKQVQSCEEKFLEMIKNNSIGFVKEEAMDFGEHGENLLYDTDDDKSAVNFKVEIDEPPVPLKAKTRQQAKRQPAKKQVTVKKPPAKKVPAKTKKLPPTKQYNTDDDLSGDGEEKQTVDGVFNRKDQNKVSGSVKEEAEDIDKNIADFVKVEAVDFGEDEIEYPSSDHDVKCSFVECKVEIDVSPTPLLKVKPKGQKTRQSVKKRVAAKKKTSKKVTAKMKLLAIKSENSENDSEDKKKEKVDDRFILRDTDFTVSEDGKGFTCSHCNQRYNVRNTLRNHIRYEHYKITRHKCTECSEIFKTVPKFVLHKLHEHNIDDRLRCNACEKLFNSESQLKKHRDIFHMLGKTFKCSICSFETFSVIGLSKHRVKHRANKDKHCKFCNKSFLRRATLQLHERIHTDDRRKVCSVCGQAFVQKASLNYHMTKYHPDVNY